MMQKHHLQKCLQRLKTTLTSSYFSNSSVTKGLAGCPLDNVGVPAKLIEPLYRWVFDYAW